MKTQLKNILNQIKNTALALFRRVKREPVLVRSFLTLLVAGGFFEISDARLSQIDAIVLAVVILLGGVATRRNVRPLTKEEKAERRRNRRITNRRKNDV
jgi:hypothetical protein